MGNRPLAYLAAAVLGAGAAFGAVGCGDGDDEALTTTNAQGVEVVIESDELENKDPVPPGEGEDELENCDPVPAEEGEDDLVNCDPIPAEQFGEDGLENNDPIPAEQFEEDELDENQIPSP